MNIKVISNFGFAVSSIQYSANGELQIRIEKEGVPTENRYEYEMCLGGGKSEQRPTYSLLKYAQEFAQNSSIKDKTKDCYRLMCKHLEKYGDCKIDSLTTEYLQGFIDYLQEQGLKGWDCAPIFPEAGLRAARCLQGRLIRQSHITSGTSAQTAREKEIVSHGTGFGKV